MMKMSTFEWIHDWILKVPYICSCYNDLTIDWSWPDFGSSIHMPFANLSHCENIWIWHVYWGSKIWSWDYIFMLLQWTQIMLLVFIGDYDLTIDLSWLNFGSSMHMPFQNVLHCENILNRHVYWKSEIWSRDYVLMLLLWT